MPFSLSRRKPGRAGRLHRQAGNRYVVTDLALFRSDPAVMHGQACIRGIRLPAAVVLACLVEGMTEDEILADHPTRSVSGIRAAAAYGAQLAAEEIVPLPRSDE